MPDKIESWSNDLMRNYVSKVHSSCSELGVKPPFQFEEFKTLMFSSGIITAFLMQVIASDTNEQG